ncbi:MAG: hypothetical protein KDK36_15930, partial [Leptospiraceae bacterium]|nr:hypothetical protein [Leptospiraceae bacterium]
MDNSYSSDKFESQWKKIQEEEDKGLPKSVLKLLENLYSKAKEENNPSQIIKTLIHIVKNRSFIEEEGIVKAIAELEKEVKSSKFPTKPILHSVLAEIYWQYYQNNRYKFYNRTATEDFKQDDIRTWDLKKIVENCSMNYQKSLEDSEKSKNLSINIFDDILYQGHRSREFRPTLYDFLSHRAIDFYLNTQSGLPQPKDSFSLEYSDTGKKGPAAKEFVYLLEVDEFVKRKIETKDKESFLFQGIKIFQDLLNFRIQQANSKKTNSVAALIDADLKRLNYIHNNTNITDKNELYLRALELLEEKYKSNEASSRVNYYIAEFFSIRAMKYSPNISDDHKWDYRSAFEICSNVIKKFPKSDGAQDCRSLQQSIKSKYFSFEIEGFNVPGKPFYGLLNYRNFNDIYGKIFTYTEEDLNNVRNLYEESRKKKEYKDYIELLITYFNKKEALKSFQYSLPDDKDFHSHSTDIKFPTLPEGKYIYLLSPSKEFTFEKNAIKVNFFQNTNISFVQRELNKFSQFILMNRESGIPIEGADVDVIAQIYHSKSGKYKNENLGKLKTDAEGRFEIPRFSDEGRNYFINIKTE